jgi:hypothetical protein
MALVRKCERCGKVDDRQEWSSPDQAAKDGAFDHWACATCAWTEFDLVDAEAERAEAARA